MTGSEGTTSPPNLDVSLVLPYYNPGAALRRTLDEAVSVLQGTGASFEIIAVSDGSTDRSERSIEGLYPGDLVHVLLPSRRGKGEALRTGFGVARGDYVGFIDADGDIPPALLADFIEVVRTRSPDLVIGSKRVPGAQVVYPLLRRLYSMAYQVLVRALFGLDVTDTQAGIKLVRREVLVDVLPRTVIEGFAFDLELMVLAERLGYTNVVEAPVRIGRRFSSTISLRAVLSTLGETMAIWWRLHVTHRYGRLESGPSTLA